MKFVRGGRVAVTGVFAIAGVFVLPGLGGLAVAHVGVGPVIVTQAGPFTVSAYDGVLAPNSQAAYRALVTLTAGRGEVNDATVTVTAELASTGTEAAPSALAGPSRHVGPVMATRGTNKYGIPGAGLGNTYEFVLPDAGRGTWHVSFAVSAPSGSGIAAFDVHGALGAQEAAAQNRTSGLLRALLLAGPLALVVIAGLAVLLRRAHQQNAAPDNS